jgi:hypothetical protein
LHKFRVRMNLRGISNDQEQQESSLTKLDGAVVVWRKGEEKTGIPVKQDLKAGSTP